MDKSFVTGHAIADVLREAIPTVAHELHQHDPIAAVLLQQLPPADKRTSMEAIGKMFGISRQAVARRYLTIEEYLLADLEQQERQALQESEH